MAAKPGEHSIDIDLPLVNSMVRNVCSLQDSGSWKDGLRTIHRVPLNIRKGDENAYEPKILSIGPYHRGHRKLQAMEVHKMRYLRELLGSNLEANITKCVEKVKKLEKEARSCYSEIIELGSEEFVEMMLLDGCFIIQFLIHRNQNEESYKQKRGQAGDPIYVANWMSPLIRHDLLILENPIPFVILMAIFDVAQSSRQETPSLMDLALNYIAHGKDRTPRTIPCASELSEVGVRFEKKKSEGFLNVTFSNRVLQMPLLSVGNSSNSLFRNLIAFEQCCPAAGSYFTSYAVLMDDLINTPRDVAILHRCGILENKLGSDEAVALLFNRLLTNVTFTADCNIYAELFKRVNAHCGSKWSKWNKWRAN